ncbi:bifunctional aconitate hydratase 2/2-methylisocitrate dehydratase [Campylobacter hyointestinalis subsp. hyointestinalis]|uniref:bifunctional aconitate hydratase 2/2-methylisocitrate dehydratase n=1 Tax=Campylobacter hyointestinalis TaxID=198 RepID=UPI00072429FC|nr:bifunctional aconitate hydratase 2/2-methylisocitrate dehydratase [Campylobacter hyointestinalis]PPB59049.1 bifunctional aconitate hydratase 2/2-methylisocitrate dehydratase [Campylobacter hyointestinalis subsp. hyointestinalis]PPB69341.1 bifunctional aconitate hydratase 2/2-methylisocitrate dehydratase [Campylobacter hyointestinalis subsp. hyointestinalis]QCT99938.1 bifunctional aconitate hydratase 2/2-methylisocitrate dehydratase [Campylobacter hyointestinalis subsp. hyointestinalis]CUU721
MGFFDDYNKAKEERLKLGIPPLPLSKEQTVQVCELLKTCATKELVDLLANRVNPGVDDAAKVKAEFLNEIINHNLKCDLIDKFTAIKMLEPMLGGYSVIVLVASLHNSDESIQKAAADVLKNTIFVHDYFNDIAKLAKDGNKYAKSVLESWANAEWFKARADIPEKIEAVVFKVAGETNTDDLSPASEAFSRSDIPLHANAMLVKRQPGSLEKIAELKKSGLEVIYVGDVVGTGSSRKSGINSIQWHLGHEIDGIPNKKTGGVILGSIIAPIFFNTAEDSGALPIVVNVDGLEMGDKIEIYPYKGEIVKDGKVIKTFKLEPNTLKDEVKAGGRIPLIIARSLCSKARAELGLGDEDIFIKPSQPTSKDNSGYTLAQKMVGRACGVEGVRAGMYVEPMTLTVGSQDTTGPMTRDEIKELASLGFSADFVLQSFCHTAAYPKPTDALMHKTLPDFMMSRGGVSLKPGDGVIHSWLNRMVLPDTVGTGGDSHTRFPIGISFPAGSGLVAFAAVLGSMPLNMPESVLVRFKGKMQPGITLRDLVNAIPYYAIKKGLLTVEKKGKINVFAGKILEIEGLPDLKVEQAFELSDASAERSAAACAVALNKEPVIEYLNSNMTLIDAMIEAGYGDEQTLARRRDKMKKWLENPTLLEADKDAKYHTVIEIDMNDIKEPILACPNDPDDVATLSEILADPKRPKNIDEVFVGSCMTNIGHYRALAEVLKGEGQVPTRLWIAPPTKMDEKQLRVEGKYSLFGAAGARTEVPGCSLCMGNQARVADNAIVFSTSTRNFDNRMGMGAQVYLGSAELAAVCAMLGRLPSVEEYMKIVPAKLAGKEDEIYKYLNFNLVPNFKLECF